MINDEKLGSFLAEPAGIGFADGFKQKMFCLCLFKGIFKIRPSKTDTFILHYSFFIIHLTVEFIDSQKPAFLRV